MRCGRRFLSYAGTNVIGMDTTTAAVFPVGLAKMLPGRELAAAMSTVDRGSLTAGQWQQLVKAQARQIAHHQAQLMSDVLTLSRIPWDGGGPITRDRADK